ncbi:hypothetical protein CAEBREN_05239 [Caenorhabditis brenneri]|uniref:Uncharacterized protein n=1 Tax=Caenorhabditis brenneri TaxID=135651 RepID=G0NQR9_CAEBE|nr:hypothetical protein CAEBREN_05239 [Caenorhabditis brenneri]
MTTAHRPTFFPARGGTARGEGDLSKLSAQYSSKDMPSHTKMKYRQTGQGTEDDLRKKDLRRELEDKERNAAREKRARDSASSSHSSSSSSSKRQRMDQIAAEAAASAVDADEAVDELNSSEDEDSDEDDTAALMAELEKIKKERAEEKAARDEKIKEKEEKERMANILAGNPLLNEPTSSGAGGSGEFQVKRRWDDDVVFKNCAKGVEERKKNVTFINDAIRSEFHKKFMDKYIK